MIIHKPLRPAPQRDNIRGHFKRGLSLTPLQALRLYDCFRLAGVVFYLRTEEMLDIRKDTIWNKKTKKTYARYYMNVTIEIENGKVLTSPSR